MVKIKQNNLFFLNNEKIEVEIGTGKKKKIFNIRQIPLVELGDFQKYWTLILSALGGILGSEWFIDTDNIKINEKLLIQHSSNIILLNASYELLKRQCFRRRFFPEMFSSTPNDNLISIIFKIPLILLYKFLNYIHIKIFWKLSHKFFIRNINGVQLAMLWYGTLLINVEGPKKKVDLIRKDSEKYFQVKPLSLKTLFPDHKVKTQTRFVQKIKPDGFVGIFDTKTSKFLSENIFLSEITRRDKNRTLNRKQNENENQKHLNIIKG